MMRITVTTETGSIFCNLEVSLELTLLDLKAILEIEVAISASQMTLLHNMQPMTEEAKNLGEYRVQDGDVIMLADSPTPMQSSITPTQSSTMPTQSSTTLTQSSTHSSITPLAADPSNPILNIDWSNVQIPDGLLRRNTAPPPPPEPADPNDPEVVRRYFLSRPAELELLRQQNPPLAQALESGDVEYFGQVLRRHVQAVRDMERQRIRMLNADPFDPEVQSRIAQEIQQKNIEENMQAAIEYTPESFSHVVMLYVQIKVNGVPVKAMVDSGAAGTIMSDTCAERCGVMRLVDRRFAGMAIGVGTQKIIGKVHLGTIQIGDDFLTSSFKVLENQSEDMLLGLDMLRSHQCCIDLTKNVLRIGTTGNEVPFITEAELKDKEETRRKQAKLIMESEDAEMAQVLAKSEEGHSQSSTNTSPPQTSSPGPSHQTTTTPSAGAIGGGVAVSESAIQQIVSRGFSREEAITELRKADGSVQLALALLLAKSVSLTYPQNL